MKTSTKVNTETSLIYILNALRTKSNTTDAINVKTRYHFAQILRKINKSTDNNIKEMLKDFSWTRCFGHIFELNCFIQFINSVRNRILMVLPMET